MPLQATSGAASYDAFGGGVAAVPNYIEDVFSTWLYTGNNSTQTITNGIDLAGKGGMVWLKSRNIDQNNLVYDTARGVLKNIQTNNTGAQNTSPAGNDLTTFGAAGFSLGTDYWGSNSSGYNYASWTFRKQPKFFDVVTYTGNGTAGRTISHSLKSAPACMFVKRLDTTGAWQVYHTWLGGSGYAVLNTTAAAPVSNTRWNNENPTSTVFTLGSDVTVNANGGTYVAYLFASNAGGFGLTGTDNVITCADYTGNGSATGPVITLGYEPQWILIKNATAVGDWNLIDNMRGFVVGGTDSELNPNLSSAESTGTFVTPTATGFQINTTDTGYNSSGQTYIYIAIRRGPMKVPTSGTSVFSPVSRSGTSSAFTQNTGGNRPDFAMIKERGSVYGYDWVWYDRLQGPNSLASNNTVQNSIYFQGVNYSAGSVPGYGNNSMSFNAFGPGNASGDNYVYEFFTRAPSFFDEVAYYRSSGAAVTHNLGVTPELLIVKRRGGAESWGVMRPNTTGYLLLNTTDALSTGLSATATSTTFTIGAGAFDYTDNYVAYLFATCAGVSKVGSYTGTGTTKQVDCGFTGGARFVLIKKTSGTGSWYVWDSARGIVSGNDPYLLLNSTAAEVTSTDYIDTYSAGFEISSTAPSEINENGGSFIFLAIS
jgi:hypothetical protein